MIRRLLIFAGVVVGVAACSPRRDEPLKGALHSDDPKVAVGERVFAWNCYECHPGGRGSVGFAINNKPLPGAMIKTQVRLGAGAMPSFSEEQISDEELDAVVRYLIALRHQ
jgi:mono/diheme cytochrome c family protein